MAYNYLDPERGINVSPRKFWVARFARIYPAYLLGLVLTAPGFIAQMLHDAAIDRTGCCANCSVRRTCRQPAAGVVPKGGAPMEFPGMVVVGRSVFLPHVSIPGGPFAVTVADTESSTCGSRSPVDTVSNSPILYLATGLEGTLASSTAMHGLFNLTFDDVGMRFVRFNPLLTSASF